MSRPLWPLIKNIFTAFAKKKFGVPSHIRKYWRKTSCNHDKVVTITKDSNYYRRIRQKHNKKNVIRFLSKNLKVQKVLKNIDNRIKANPLPKGFGSFTIDAVK